VTQVALNFDAGSAADVAGKRGLQNMVMSLLDEGTTDLTSQQIAEEKERLGASLSTGGSSDRSSVTLSALSANLAPSLALMADVARNAAFRPDDVERLRTQLVNAAQQAKSSPTSMAQREYFRQLFGTDHPYGATPLGDEEAIKAFSADDLRAFQAAWLRPDNAELFVVSDRPLAEVQAALDTAFGDWAAPAAPRGTKSFAAIPAAPAKGPRIVLIDRPGSPQSVIYGGQVTPLDPRSDLTAAAAGSDVLGSATFSRINLDLREAKGWAYSPYSIAVYREHAVPYLINAAVQADRTGDSVAELVKITRELLSSKKVTKDELGLSVASAIGELPGQFQTSDAVLAAMQSNALYGRPDNYYETLADRYRALDTAGVDAALAGMLDANALTFVVVGDAKSIRGQLDKLGYPLEVVPAR
jgi:predicted Zn-dependent peptidase